MSAELNIYDLSRAFFDWAFENPEKIHTNHVAIYFFAIEHCNRLGWKEKYGFPTQMVMDALGIKKHQTYIRYFNDLCEWGFLKLVQKSANQYSANIISLQSAKPKNSKALDKAFINHRAKQTETIGQSKGSIDIPIYNNTNTQLTSIQLETELKNSFSMIENTAMMLKLKKQDVEIGLENFILRQRAVQNFEGRTIEDLRTHFVNSISKGEITKPVNYTTGPKYTKF